MLLAPVHAVLVVITTKTKLSWTIGTNRLVAIASTNAMTGD